MNKVEVSFEQMKTYMLKDEKFKMEYEKLRPRYEAIEQIIAARKEHKITQAVTILFHIKHETLIFHIYYCIIFIKSKTG